MFTSVTTDCKLKEITAKTCLFHFVYLLNNIHVGKAYTHVGLIFDNA